MAVKISELDTTTTVTGDEITVVVQNGLNKAVALGDIVPIRRTAAEISAGVTPTSYGYESGPHVDCWRFMTAAMIAGTADCATAIQNALNSLPRGGRATLKPNDAGYQLGEANITVPYGCQLVGMTETGLPLNRFAENGSINSSTLPGGVFFRVTSTSLPPIVLRSNSCVRGITFWYPNQNWSITSLVESFTTYPAAIQLGDSTDAGPYHPVVIGCQFLGATSCIKQYATDGSTVKGATVKSCTGVLLGDFLRLNISTDVVHVADCHLTPNAITAFVGDGSVGGDVDVFRAKCAQAAKVFHIGSVDGLHVTDVFAFGVLNFWHANNGMFTGDTNESFSGFIVNSGCDSCYQAFVFDRDNNAFPLNVCNSFFAPNFRPNGVAGDAATQAFMYFAAGLEALRINVSNVRISGGAVGEFPAGYSGQRDYDFGIAGVLGTGSIINVDGFSSHNLNTSILQTGLDDDVAIGNHTLSDVAQKVYGLVGFNARSGGFYLDGLRLITSDGTRVYLAPDGEDIRWGKALVSLGGGAAPTLGTIGGSGPAVATQDSWMRVVDSTGAAFWVPVWK